MQTVRHEYPSSAVAPPPSRELERILLTRGQRRLARAGRGEFAPLRDRRAYPARMSGYAATARLTGVPIAPGSTLRADDRGEAGLAGAIEGELEAGVASAEPPASWEDRLHYIREAWAQTTFFLFDPESWR